MDAKRMRETVEMAVKHGSPVVLPVGTTKQLKDLIELGEAAKALLPFVMEVKGLKPLSPYAAHEIASGLNL